MALFCRTAAGVCVWTASALELVGLREEIFAYASESLSPKECDESCCALVCAQRIAPVPAKDLRAVCRMVKFHQPPNRLKHASYQIRPLLFGSRRNVVDLNRKHLASLIHRQSHLARLPRLRMGK